MVYKQNTLFLISITTACEYQFLPDQPITSARDRPITDQYTQVQYATIWLLVATLSYITYFGLVIVPMHLILCSKCMLQWHTLSIWSHSIVLKYYIRIYDKVASKVAQLYRPWLQARQAPRLGHIFIKLSYQLLDSIAQNTYAINMLLIYIIYNYK